MGVRVRPLRSSLIPVVLAGAALVGAACSPSPTPPPFPTSFVVVVPTASGDGACRGIALSGAILAGDQNDPRVTWLDTPDGRRDIVWPAGYTARFARFNSPFEILDANGRVVYRRGDSISGGCVAGPTDDPGSLLLVGPTVP